MSLVPSHVSMPQTFAWLASVRGDWTHNALLQAGCLEHGAPDIGPAGEVNNGVPLTDVGQQEPIQRLQVVALCEVAPI